MRLHLATMSQTVQRPLTRTEQEALAYHSARGLAAASWGPTMGIAAGVYRTYATRAEFRWPVSGKLISEAPAEGEVQRGFWDGEKMRAGGREIFKGVSAQAKANALHVARGFAYCLIGVFFVPLVVSSYAATVSAVGELRDPRLQDVNRGVREATMREMKQKQEKAGEIAKQPGDARRIPTRDRAQTSRNRAGPTEVDDASPTGGASIMMDMVMDDEQQRLTGDMGGVLSDGQMRTAEARARPLPPTSNRAATYQPEKVEREQPKDFASDFDDASSPSGGSGAMMDGSGDGGGGSVWERIRQQSASDPSSSSSSSNVGRGRGAIGSGGVQQPGDDSFTFSSSAQETSYAKSEAQKEFDERVEKERRGGDFNSSSSGDGLGRRGRWS